MNIATWNVNSIRARIDRVAPWLREHQPDVVCLQETKVVNELFPRELLEDEGYNLEVFGQKAYNGVAILSKHPVEDVVRGLPGDGEDAERRVIGCIVKDFMILNLYVPNGQNLGTEKFKFKLEWLGRLRQFLDEKYDTSEKVVVTGDFNITFDDRDVHDPERLRETIHCSTPEREALQHVMDFGLDDALRKHHEEAGIYTWWHYRAGAFFKKQGLRIDHFLVSAPALEVCTGVEVHTAERAEKGSSDHAPVVASFEDA
jgi:exodeoxyribonuclease-3